MTAALRTAIETDRFPCAPRLDPLRSALTKLQPATAQPAPEGPAGQSRQSAAAVSGPKGKRPGSTGAGRASVQKPSR
jgi:hypothetical protein